MKGKSLKITPAVKSAFEQWNKGVGRKQLAKDLHTNRASLRKAFVEISGLTWKELRAKRAKVKKATRKGGKKEAASASA
jgi:methylphosphotriester-DNA--protein-cysteine methyltransferase